MKSLREYIQEAEEKKQAIGHFNIASIEMFWGIVEAAKEANTPVIIGLSEGERSAVGVRQAKMLVESVREEYTTPLFINADHSHKLEAFKAAVDTDYDAAIIDAAGEPYETNVAVTKEAVQYANEADGETLVEAELGYIGTSSKIIDEIPEGAGISGEMLTSPEEAAQFVSDTGIDLFAPAVGNLHGMFKKAGNPALDIERIKNIREAAGVPLVLHGGSGITDDDFRAAIEAGISTVHVSTEIRVAYREAIEKSLAANSDELAPYRYMSDAVEAVKEVVAERIKLFSGAS